LKELMLFKISKNRNIDIHVFGISVEFATHKT